MQMPMTEEEVEEEIADKAYEAVGCYADNISDRVLGHLMKSPEMTTEVRDQALAAAPSHLPPFLLSLPSFASWKIPVPCLAVWLGLAACQAKTHISPEFS